MAPPGNILTMGVSISRSVLFSEDVLKVNVTDINSSMTHLEVSSNLLLTL